MRWMALSSCLVLAGCSVVGGWKMPWARDCADRPSEIAAHVQCRFGGLFRAVESKRHPCAEGGGLLGDGRAMHIADEYKLVIAREGSDEPFARVKIEQSVRGRYSQHKSGLMDTLHTMSPKGVPGREVNGFSTFTIDESASDDSAVETIAVVFSEREPAIATIQFLRTSAGERPRELQGDFVEAYTSCLAK
ncbi:MAG: hypothetical protein ACREQJ_03940 [Candidatus Binatia bacterium]